MIDVLLPIAAILALVIVNGVFVAAEFAIVGVSRVELETSMRAGNPAARLVLWIITDPRRHDRFIATAQLGITAASLGLGMYGEHQLADEIAARLTGWEGERWITAHTVASVVAITLLTYFHIVLGEMVPKSLALDRPGRMAIWIVPIVRALQFAVYPLVVRARRLAPAVRSRRATAACPSLDAHISAV